MIAVICLLFQGSILASDRTYGEVTGIDTDTHQMIIAAECSCGSGKVIEVKFIVKDGTKVLLNGKEAKLAELKKGDEVAVDSNDTPDNDTPDEVLKVAATRDTQ